MSSRCHESRQSTLPLFARMTMIALITGEQHLWGNDVFIQAPSENAALLCVESRLCGRRIPLPLSSPIALTRLIRVRSRHRLFRSFRIRRNFQWAVVRRECITGRRFYASLNTSILILRFHLGPRIKPYKDSSERNADIENRED